MPVNDYTEYLLSSEWKVVRRIALEFAGYRCQVCNSSEKLQVHHRSYDNIGAETLSDVIVLCETCHSLFHGKQDNVQEDVETKVKKEIKEAKEVSVTTAVVRNDSTFEKPDIRIDIEDLLEIGLDYVGIKGVNRLAIRRIMESIDIDLKYHTKVCDTLDNFKKNDLEASLDYILSE